MRIVRKGRIEREKRKVEGIHLSTPHLSIYLYQGYNKITKIPLLIC